MGWKGADGLIVSRCYIDRHNRVVGQLLKRSTGIGSNSTGTVPVRTYTGRPCAKSVVDPTTRRTGRGHEHLPYAAAAIAKSSPDSACAGRTTQRRAAGPTSACLSRKRLSQRYSRVHELDRARQQREEHEEERRAGGDLSRQIHPRVLVRRWQIRRTLEENDEQPKVKQDWVVTRHNRLPQTNRASGAGIRCTMHQPCSRCRQRDTRGEGGTRL